MAERAAEGGGSFPYLNTLLVLLTLVGGVWLVSSKLTSTRPAGVAGAGGDFPREQTMESRLWEDPFKTRGRPGDASRLPVTTPHGLRTLIQVQADGREDVLILPVMIPGGFYSEDQETRIRSRFAIASALTQSSYVPDDAERLGAVTLLWPTTQGMKQVGVQLEHTINKDNPQAWLVKLWSLDDTGLEPTAATRLDLRYEWYRRKPSFETRRTAPPPRPAHILVLWLNERYFADMPLLRLPLLLAPIIEALRETHCILHDGRVALIGPGRSSTLRRMLPEWETERKTVAEALQRNNSKVLQNIKDAKILKNITFHPI